MTDVPFKVTIPATLEKSEEGDWRVFGLASTANKDLQGEIVSLKGLDLSPIEKGRGVFNFDHKKGPENTIGAIDSFNKTDKGLYLGGYLFKNHDRAKAIHQIMSSLKKSDKGRMGMSIEGIVKARSGEDGKTIKHAVITSCALTMNPVNEDTYINLMKSFSEVEFSGDALTNDFFGENETKSTEKAPAEVMFTASQVSDLLKKALGVGAAYASTPPAELSGGDALAQEDLAHVGNVAPEKPKKKKKEMSKELIKSTMGEILAQLQMLHPDVSRSALWEALKTRMYHRVSEFGEE